MLSLPLLLGPFTHCELLEDEAEETGEQKRGCSPAFWRILHAMAWSAHEVSPLTPNPPITWPSL